MRLAFNTLFYMLISCFLHMHLCSDAQEAKAARATLISPHGDALTLLNVFETWLAIKQGTGGPGGAAGAGGAGGGRGGGGGGGGGGGRQSSARWCRKHGLAEARLYEMAKLRAQFAELLMDAGILRWVVHQVRNQYCTWVE